MRFLQKKLVIDEKKFWKIHKQAIFGLHTSFDKTTKFFIFHETRKCGKIF